MPDYVLHVLKDTFQRLHSSDQKRSHSSPPCRQHQRGLQRCPSDNASCYISVLDSPTGKKNNILHAACSLITYTQMTIFSQEGWHFLLRYSRCYRWPTRRCGLVVCVNRRGRLVQCMLLVPLPGWQTQHLFHWRRSACVWNPVNESTQKVYVKNFYGIYSMLLRVLTINFIARLVNNVCLKPWILRLIDELDHFNTNKSQMI